MLARQRPELTELRNHFKKNKKIREYNAHNYKVHSVGWSCDGRRLASGSFDKTVSIFTLDRERLTKEHNFSGHDDSVDQICWHTSNANLLCSASGDKTVRIWDARSKNCVSNIETKGQNINITWSPNGNAIAVGNKADLISFIDTRNYKVRDEKQFNFEVNEISWNKDGNLFFLTNNQGCVHILNYPKLELQHVLQAHPGICICIEFDPTGKYFAIGSSDALVSLWQVDELVCLRTFQRLDWPVRTVSFSHDGKLLASASEDLVIDIADVASGEKVAEVAVVAATFTVAWHPKHYLLAYACDDKQERKGSSSSSASVKLFGCYGNND